MAERLTATVAMAEMAEALLRRDALRLRLLVQAWLRTQPNITALPPIATADQQTLVAAAALTELLASRLNQAPPAWTKSVGGLPQPFFVMKSGEKLGFTRNLCLTESPEPFKRRNIFAPGNFLNMV